MTFLHFWTLHPETQLIILFVLLLLWQFPSSGKSFQELQAQLNEVAAGLNQSANEVVQASRGTTQDLAKATSKFGQDFSNFLDAGVDMAGTSQVSVVTSISGVFVVLSKQNLDQKAHVWVHFGSRSLKQQ